MFFFLKHVSFVLKQQNETRFSKKSQITVLLYSSTALVYFSICTIYWAYIVHAKNDILRFVSLDYNKYSFYIII